MSNDTQIAAHMRLLNEYVEACNAGNSKNHLKAADAARQKVEASALSLISTNARSEPDCAGGMPCTKCPDKRKCQYGCLRQGEASENPNRKDLRAECDAVDALLRGLGLDPERCRTEGGALNAGRALSLLKDGCTTPPPAPVLLSDAWQPIETAPKDRTLLLGYFNSHGKWRTLRGQWFSQESIEDTWEEPEFAGEGWYETPVEIDDTPNCFWTEPTHWQPLPSPPIEQAIGRASRWAK